LPQLAVTIKKNSEIRTVLDKGVKASNQYCAIFFRKNETGVTRYAIVASKKVGNAVTRNKVRRRLRHILLGYPFSAVACCDIVILVRKSAAEAEFSELSNGIYRLLQRYRVSV